MEAKLTYPFSEHNAGAEELRRLGNWCFKKVVISSKDARGRTHSRASSRSEPVSHNSAIKELSMCTTDGFGDDETSRPHHGGCQSLCDDTQSRHMGKCVVPLLPS